MIIKDIYRCRRSQNTENRKKGIKIQFKNGIKKFVYSEINDYGSLKSLIEKIRIKQEVNKWQQL